MISKQHLIAIIGVIAIAALVVWVMMAPPQTPSQVQNEFSQEGILVKETFEDKPDVWRLNYGESQTKELDVAAISVAGVENGMRVKVRGIESNNKVVVSDIDIINANKDDLIWVASPLPNQEVASPLTVAGFARGNWYFEASFPIKLLDGNGKVLLETFAQAQGEWMTTNYVPFSKTLVFSTPTTAEGTLVLEKDNPSGLSENANELRIPVTFGNIK